MNFAIIFKKFLHFFNLESELENHDRVYEEIEKGIVFKGTNLWILIFAIIVASVGLNMNSTAVVIGAMLISPLMGPINGMGYSIATYNFELFRKSIKNYSFAILTSLAASAAYFALSPISTAHSELLARTSPTIYDVLIALFGGLAGIVAISSKQKGNVIPGVAIATALMPPLCTAGYGLATAQFNFFFGAFYLFTINTIFIALAAVWVSQLLKFPIRTIIDPSQKKRINSTITTVITLVLLPSIFFGYKLIEKEKFIQHANLFIGSITIYEGNYLLKSEIDDKKRAITLVYGGRPLSEEQKNDILEKSKNFKIDPQNITIKQGLTFSNINDPDLETIKLKEEILRLNELLQRKQAKIDSIEIKQNFGNELLNEIKPIYPQIHNFLYSEAIQRSDSVTSQKNIPVIIIQSKEKLSESDEKKLRNWLKQKTKCEEVRIFNEIV
ncbi:MAG: DUF389 domain-containing protein [Thermaurantimonas sp.]